MFNRSLFSSDSSEWETPPELFAQIEAKFGPFDLDPCAALENAKAEDFFSKDDDGLSRAWYGRVFVNPPYGRGIGVWVSKCLREAQKGNASLVVALLPARTDTKWWHSWVMLANEVYFVEGRVRFVGAKSGAPFPSAIVVWKRVDDDFETHWDTWPSLSDA